MTAREPASSPDDEQALDEAMELMHFAFRRVVEAPDRVLAQRGLSRLHHRILYVVGHNPGIVVSDVVALLGVTKQAVHRPLRQLVEAGLVAGSPGDDRRQKTLDLTAQGRRLERRLARLQHAMFRRAFEEVGLRAELGWRRAMDVLGGRRRLKV
ncbi:MAG: helix-turn-helix domain-containing protein [Polyangiaceae bacterium]